MLASSLFLTAGRNSGASLLSLLATRVEMAVRKFYQSVDQSTACDPALLADILSGIRRDVEQSVPVGSAANGSCTPQMDTGEPWILCLIRQMLCEASEALMTPSSVELEEGAVGHGGRAAVAAASAAGIPSEARNFDSILGSRAEEDVRMQFCALSEDLREIFDSDLFVEALQQALEEAFGCLHASVVDRVFLVERPVTASADGGQSPVIQEGGVGWGGNQAVHTDGTDEATHGAMSVEEGGVVELEYVERPLIKIVPAVSNLFIAIMQSSTDPTMGFVCVCCAALCRWWVSVVTVCPEVHASTDRLCVACVKTCHNTYCDFKQELDALRSMCCVLPQMQRALRGCSDQLVIAYAAVDRTATVQWLNQ